MPTPSHPTDQPCHRAARRLVPALALAAALALGATGCGDDPEAASSSKDSTEKATEKSVKAFYARASKAYKDGDAEQLCRMTHPDFAAEMVDQAAAAGLDVSTCPQMWDAVLAQDPQGYQDKISTVVVKGKTATFRSGNDPWRLRLVDGKWLIVAPQ